MYMPTAGCQFSAEDLIIWFLQKVTSSALKGTNVTHTLSMVSKYPSWRLRYCFPKNQIAHTLMCIDTNQNTLCSFENGCQSIFSGIWQQSCNVMMTSSNGNIFRVTGPLCGNSPVKGDFPNKDQWRGALMFYLICAEIKCWVNDGDAGDLRRHPTQYDVIEKWTN